MAKLTWDHDMEFRFPLDELPPYYEVPHGYLGVPKQPVPQPMPALRTHPLQLVLNKFTYRTNWEFFLFYDGGVEYNRLVLAINVVCQNSYPPYRQTTVLHHRAVPEWKDVGTDSPSFWQTFLFEQVQAVENHECAEWFTIDGKKPFDPHKVYDSVRTAPVKTE